MINLKNIFIATLILSILTIGITLRFYNVNIENFWIDEMVTFWVSDPNITFNETLKRNIETDLHFLKYILV